MLTTSTHFTLFCLCASIKFHSRNSTMSYYFILYYITLYYTMLYYIILYYIILYYIMLYYLIILYIIFYIILYYIMLHYIILYYVLILYFILYYIILYYIILYYIIFIILLYYYANTFDVVGFIHRSKKIVGKDVTPFVLDRVNQLTKGKSLEASIFSCVLYSANAWKAWKFHWDWKFS